MTIEDELHQSLQQALSALGIEKREVSFEHPADLAHGDYSTNAALELFSRKVRISLRPKLKKYTEAKGEAYIRPRGEEGVSFQTAKGVNFHSPRQLASLIVIELQKNLPAGVEKTEVAGAGFINFYLTKEFFAENIREALRQAQDYGKNKALVHKKVMVEYTDPNPFKEFHIGHLMSNAIGESVARIFEYNGANVLRACWQGDVGLHVAKAIFGMEQNMNEVSNILHFRGVTEHPSVLLGRWYVFGAHAYETDEKSKKAIGDINVLIYKILAGEKNGDPRETLVANMYKAGREASLAYFEDIYRRLGTKFNYYFYESEEGRKGQAIVEENLGKGIFEKSDGAVVFKGEPYGLHTRVFINSLGLPTYEAKELGLNKRKFELEPDLYKSVIITGNEINEYFKVLLKVMSLIMPKVAEKTVHLPHGMLRMTTGKMSSRKGNVITGEGLIAQVKALVVEKIKEPTSAQGSGLAKREMSEKEKETVAEQVAIGAIKYSILRQAIGGDIIFDFEKSISFEGDSGPYLQYSYVRAKAVLAKAKEVGLKPCVGVKLLQKWETSTLEKLLYRFPEVVERAGAEYQPHYVTTYLTELAGVFNSWYANEKIIDANDPASPYKLALTEAFATVIKNGLSLLGIKVPERM